MKFYNQDLLDCLPKGAEVVNIVEDTIDPKRICVEYQYQDKIHQVIPERINLLETLKYRQDFLFHFEQGMTVNFLYELFSTRHNLGFIEGEDYDSCNEIFSFKSKMLLPIRSLSLRYQPVNLPIELVNKRDGFFGDEGARNLLAIDANPFKHNLRKQLLEISTYLIDGRGIVCFNQKKLTPEFISLIMAKVRLHDDTILNELHHSKVIGMTNDGLSDVVILSGPNIIHYLIRFISNKNDLPKR